MQRSSLGGHPMYSRIRWSRRYRIAHTGDRALWRSAQRHVLRLSAAGVAGPAYRLAVALSRHHVRRGRQFDAMTMEDLVGFLAPWVPLRRGRTVEALAHAARQAVAHEDWPLALDYMDTILALDPHNVDQRGRALRNRATALHTLGRFSDAVDAYDRLIADREVWQRMTPEYQAGFRLSRAAVIWYLERPLVPQDIADTTIFLGHAPATWVNYWWVLGHIAWRRHPDRVPGIRRGSLRTFAVEWPLALDRALWGLDLLAASDDAWGDINRRVRGALNDATTAQHIGRNGWLDLYADWLFAQLARRTPDAPTLVQEHAAWCAERGHDGWAVYWRSQLAANNRLD